VRWLVLLVAPRLVNQVDESARGEGESRLGVALLEPALLGINVVPFVILWLAVAKLPAVESRLGSPPSPVEIEADLG